jgi:lipoyl(octanoyl) transferase
MLALQRVGLAHAAERQDDITGVWVDNTKVAAVGIKCRKWITMHGVAINVTPQSLEHFGGIIPCGLEGRTVGCLEQYLVPDTEPLSVSEFAMYMQEALQDVFQISLVPADTTRFQI